MLGKLTRWLRMLGQDVTYTGSMDDKELIQKSKNENRTLLTQDQELYKQALRKSAEAFLVQGKTEAEKLATLAERFKIQLKIDASKSRCPKCNTRIEAVSKNEVMNKIPEKTMAHYEEFWECPTCDQVYWQGAHWKKIQETLTEAEKHITKNRKDAT